MRYILTRVVPKQVAVADEKAPDWNNQPACSHQYAIVYFDHKHLNPLQSLQFQQIAHCTITTIGKHCYQDPSLKSRAVMVNTIDRPNFLFPLSNLVRKQYINYSTYPTLSM